MSGPYLSVRRIERHLSNGNSEGLSFESGVNVLVGRPNTGKTKWLQILDFLLGDAGTNPFENLPETELSEKYEAANVALLIGEEQFTVERKWKEPGGKTKVFVNGAGMTTPDFQRLLLEKLKIPLVHFPKGSPMSGQTWPELSFRMLLRHIYRQQRFWGDLADQQPKAEQHACLLQFVGLAERIFTAEYGRLIELKMDVERLKARREQYGFTLTELAGDLLTGPGMRSAVTEGLVREAEGRLTAEMNALREQRIALISQARDQGLPPEQLSHVGALSEKRADFLIVLEELRRRSKAATERLGEVRVYVNDLAEELDRMARAEDAGAVLADLQISHCPACDQPVKESTADPGYCFLCHQLLPEQALGKDQGDARLQFERDRLTGEFKEAKALLEVLERDVKRLHAEIAAGVEALRMLENELEPARQAISALVQTEVSAIDMRLGELNERQRQIGRLRGALELEGQLTARIQALEKEIKPLQTLVDESVRAMDFAGAEGWLADGMNEYLEGIKALRPGVWRHSPIVVDLSRDSFSIRVGRRKWEAALGGTDTLYFLMGYSYGLLTLSHREGCHYPGLSIIDVPGEFAGEAVEDKENFILQPFIDLLARDSLEGSQMIVTGAAFANLQGTHRRELTEVYVA